MLEPARADKRLRGDEPCPGGLAAKTLSALVNSWGRRIGWGKPPGGRVAGTGTGTERGPGGRGTLFERIAAADGERGRAAKEMSIGSLRLERRGHRARGIEGAGVSLDEKTGMLRTATRVAPRPPRRPARPR